jgi:formylglycine-generating enzyme
MTHRIIAAVGIAFLFLVSRAVSWAEVPDGFALVKAGTFTMGSPAGEGGRRNDEKQHGVRISRDFYMSKYEVTQGQWEAVMGNNPSDKDYGIGERYPVNRVSWYDAIEYCNKRSRLEGLTPVYTHNGEHVTWNKNANGYRLPTEAEWEYAARGGHVAKGYHIYAGSDSIDEVAWYKNTSGGKTHPVGEKQANELGIHDMSGNVYEWCWDSYTGYPDGSVSDPTGPESPGNRVTRGGSWGLLARLCRSAFRSYGPQEYSSRSIGFRVARRP